MRTIKLLFKCVIILVFTTLSVRIADAQDDIKIPVLSYHPVEGFFHLPQGVNFGEVTGVALDNQGHIFVFNRGLHPIIEFTQDGEYVRTLADGKILGAFGEMGRKTGQFMFSHSVTVAPDGSLFVSEILNWRVQKFLP